MDMITLDRIALCVMCAPACGKNFIHQMYGVRIITLSSLQVCVGNAQYMHRCMYVRMNES